MILPIKANHTENKPSFESRNSYIKPCHKVLGSLGEMTFENYQKFSNLEKEVIRKCTPERLKELAKVNCDFAEKFITDLDNLYGQNNYSVIMLGRSLATIGETMREMGKDVKIIPLSNLRHFSLAKVKDIDIYKAFLKSIGLTKEVMNENPNKKYILMDYAYSGASLENAKEFLEQDILLGKCENLIPVEINSLKHFDYKLRQIFEFSRFKTVAPIDRLPYTELKDTFSCANYAKECKYNITKFLRNLFLFNMFDSLANKNYQNFIPEKELKSLERNTTQTALKSKTNKALEKLKNTLKEFANEM